ncbi:hypothetical protein B0J14DRAFT_565482 [Halenospora varia]|nr:hypothetical protein B0J14DRAFT_565482 [Halenospora varia]
MYPSGAGLARSGRGRRGQQYEAAAHEIRRLMVSWRLAYEVESPRRFTVCQYGDDSAKSANVSQEGCLNVIVRTFGDVTECCFKKQDFVSVPAMIRRVKLELVQPKSRLHAVENLKVASTQVESACSPMPILRATQHGTLEEMGWYDCVVRECAMVFLVAGCYTSLHRSSAIFLASAADLDGVKATFEQEDYEMICGLWPSGSKRTTVLSKYAAFFSSPGFPPDII